MSKRYFNWKLAIVLVLSILVLGITAIGIRRWRKANSAEQGLVRGNKAYDEQDWEEAAKELGIYLSMKQDDVLILLKYAEAQMNIRPLKNNNIQQAIASYRAALRVEGSHSEAALKLTDIYLKTGMPSEAELIAQRQLEKAQDPTLRRMLAIALAQQRKFKEAGFELKAICTEYPEQILAYESFGQLIERYPDEFSEQAAFWFDEAVKNNPTSAMAYLARAAFSFRNTNESGALADINKAEQQDLSDTSVRLRLAMELINLNILDKAEQHLEECHKTEPSSQELWQLWAQLALRSQSKEKILNVAETGLRELAAQPWDFMPMAAELFIRSGQLERAAECISELRQKEVSQTVVTYLEGFMASEQQNLYEAIKSWQQTIESGNNSIKIRLALASALSRIGDRQSALQQLYTLLAERPDSFEGHLALAKMLAQTAEWTKVQEHTSKAMELEPSNPEPVILYLQAQIQLFNDPSGSGSTQVLQEIEKQISTLNKTQSGNLELGLLQLQFLLQQGDFANARELITRLEKEHPSQVVMIRLAKAELLTSQDKITEAISTLDQTIKEFPDAPRPVRYLAILLYRQGDQKRSEAVLKNAIERIEQPEIQRELGLLLVQFYTRWDQIDYAYTLVSQLAQKLPNDIPIKRRLLLFEQVVNDPEKAQQIIDSIKSLEGEDGWQWRYEQARIWFIAENFKQHYPRIILLLQENLHANPGDKASRVLLAGTYDKAGELQLAISTYRDALNRSPNNLNIITSTIAALYKAKEYDQAEELLNRASRQKLQDPQLQKLQLQSHLRRGQLDSASDILLDLLNSDPNNQNAYLTLALLKIQQNEFEESEELLAKLKAQNPDSLAITATQIQLYLRQDKPEEALKINQEMVNRLKNASAHILSARTYATLGQFDKALEDLGQAVALEPDNTEVWVARSDFFYTTGKINEAVADIRHALSLAPDDIQIQKRVISLSLSSGQSEVIQEGNALLDQALESNPEDIELQLFKSRSLLTKGTTPAIEEARRTLQKITENNPEVNQAWLLLGELALRQGQPGIAADVAMRGLAYIPNDKTLLLLKARAEAVRSPILAIPTLKELCGLDPNNTDAVTLLASTYMTIDEPQKAVDLLRQQLLTCEPTIRRQFRTVLAVALYKTGMKSEAQAEFNTLQESDPNDPNPLLVQAKLLKEDQLWSQLNLKVIDWYQKHPNDSHTPIAIARELVTSESNEAKQTAEDMLRMILKNDPASIEAMSILAILLEMIGRHDESIQLYERIIKLNPENLVAINNLAWMLSEHKGQYKQALELAQKGLKLAPNYIDILETRGVVYYRLGDFDKAVEDLDNCTELYPASTTQYVAASFHLARALDKLGNKEEALKKLKQALELESKIGGLSTKELAEAQRLLGNLQEGL